LTEKIELMHNALVIEGLERSEIFKNVDTADLERIAQTAKTQSYSINEIIVREGEPSDRFFLITNGIVAVKKIMKTGPDQIFAYLLRGNTFGEVGILENKPRSATVTAISNVEALIFDRTDFLKILREYSEVAIALAKLLGYYLTESNKRLSRGNREKKVALIFDPFNTSGASFLGWKMAAKLKLGTEKSTVFIEYPDPGAILEEIQYDGQRPDIFTHPDGVDILLNPDTEYFPEDTRLALLIDHKLNDYDNIVVYIRNDIKENVGLILENADQVIVVGSDRKEEWKATADFHAKIHTLIKNQQTKIFTILIKSEHKANHNLSPRPDFEVAFAKDTTDNLLWTEDEQEHLEVFNEAVHTFVDRLQKNNHLGIFIPTTINVNQKVDNSRYVQKTLNFLGERFGGATSEEAQGIWNSQEIGLVGERLFKVHTYASSSDLKRHLDDVVDYVKRIKIELKQEAMALEINQKLTLI
jgi:hypothetical protein